MRPAVPDVRRIPRSDQRSDLGGHASFIYFHLLPDGQRVKIGSTERNPKHRFREQNEGGRQFLAAVPGTEEQEIAIHRHFKHLLYVDPDAPNRTDTFWWRGDVRAFVEWVAEQSFSASSWDPDALAESWAPPDWLPWMQPLPRVYDDQAVLPFIGWNWMRLPPANTSDEYYTRESDVAPARELMGGIELDPASHQNANAVIQAERYYTTNDEALHLGWQARSCWLNPPYSLSARFVGKLIAHHEAGDIQQAIAFISARSVGDNWFHDVDVWRYPICFRRGRARFDGPDGQGEGAHFGHLWVYLGPDPERFREMFEPYGAVVRRA